jgi:FG-GAP-like repeat
VLGNFDEAWVSSASLEAIVQIIGWKFAINDVDPRQPTWVQAGAGSPVYPPGTWLPTPRIFAHRDVGQTACPGGYLYYWLDAIRNSVNERAPGLAPPGTAVGGDFVGGPETDVFLRQPGVLGDTLLAGTSFGLYPWSTFGVDGAFSLFAGDFDANGFDDIFFYAAGPGTDWLWLSNGDGSFRQSVTSPSSSLQIPIPGDFDADGDDDIMWYGPGATGENLWIAQNGSFSESPVWGVDAVHTPVPGDFNGDGKDEILWAGSPNSWVWERFGGTFYGRATWSAVGNFLPASGDFDADGDDDVMWYAPGPASDWIWTAQGGEFFGSASQSVPDYFTNVLAGNIDGVGGEDLLWYASPGQDWWWRYMAGRQFADQGVTNVPLR